MSGAPGYWTNETSGVLAPAVRRYLAGDDLTSGDVGAMRAYLRQWIAGDWLGDDDLARLRERVLLLDSTASLRAWLRDAEAMGIDPL